MGSRNKRKKYNKIVNLVWKINIKGYKHITNIFSFLFVTTFGIKRQEMGQDHTNPCTFVTFCIIRRKKQSP